MYGVPTVPLAIFLLFFFFFVVTIDNNLSAQLARSNSKNTAVSKSLIRHINSINKPNLTNDPVAEFIYVTNNILFTTIADEWSRFNFKLFYKKKKRKN